MAQRVTTELIDDLDGRRAAETVSFGIDGTTYEIDLSTSNAKALRRALDEYVAAGRKLGKGKGTGKALKAANAPKPAEIRLWAKQNGYDVPDRGRLPAEVMAAWESAS